MEKNPFDLSGRKTAGPSRPYKAHVWTEEEIKEKLTGYLEVPGRHWHRITYGSHVRYYTKADGYKPGGFVAKNPFDTKPKGTQTEKRFIKLQNNFDGKRDDHSSWIVAYEDIEHLYVKADAPTLVMMDMIQEAVVQLNKNVNKTYARVELVENRVAVLERRNTK